jgi:hypothetical protein
MRARLRERVLLGAGAAVFVLMWLPPFIQQVTNHPGNATLIYRFFAAGHPGQTAKAALWSVSAVYGVVIIGPSEVMSSLLGSPPHHTAITVVVTVVALLLGAAVTIVGIRQRERFAAGLGVLSLVGYVAMVIAVTHVVGFVFGYLVVWAIAVPWAALIGMGMVRLPFRIGSVDRSPISANSALRLGLCVVGLAASVALCVRVAAIPALGAVSDPNVGRLTALVTPGLDIRGSVFVGDSGAGTGTTQLLDTEEFIGLVNRLDQSGYHPKVNTFWKAQFGPGYLASGRENRLIELSTWTAASPGRAGYAGRVGDMAVTVTTPDGRPARH